MRALFNPEVRATEINIGTGNERTILDLANRIKFISELKSSERQNLSNGLREIVIKDHSLGNFIKRILSVYNNG